MEQLREDGLRRRLPADTKMLKLRLFLHIPRLFLSFYSRNAQSNEVSSLVRRRCHTTSYREAISSIMYLHSESLNVWSHLLGTLWFCSSAIRFTGTATSLWSTSAAAIIIFLIANIFCFACSTFYHLFADHAQAGVWLRLDHLGIVCAILASSIAFLALSLGCHNGEKYVYMGLVTAAAAVSSHRLSGNLQNSHSERPSRITTYIILGSVAAIPALRCWYLDEGFRLLPDFGMMAIINTSGGAIYATHLLDQAIEMKLGLPDVSHLTMHVLAIVGAMVYEEGLMLAYQESLSKGLTLRS
jgi:adiponectin receptor